MVCLNSILFSKTLISIKRLFFVQVLSLLHKSIRTVKTRLNNTYACLSQSYEVHGKFALPGNNKSSICCLVVSLASKS